MHLQMTQIIYIIDIYEVMILRINLQIALMRDS